MTNYALHQPSYAHSAATTEFDDALLQRGIVTREQVLLAKGMSVADAERFLRVPNDDDDAAGRTDTGEVSSSANNRSQTKDSPSLDEKMNGGESDSDNSDEDDEDDEFMKEYRKKRLQELHNASAATTDPDCLDQKRQRRRFGQAIFIDRTDWIREVNEGSVDSWVIVCLTSSDSERTGLVQRHIQDLAVSHEGVKFVCIPAHSAIPNWPTSNLPSLFVYRHGSLHHELLRLAADISIEELEQKLIDLLVLE